MTQSTVMPVAPRRTGRSVLLVEDERLVATDIQETLNELGYDAYAIASSADEAIATASRRCPDLILMDVRIKGQRDGVETAAVLRERFGSPVIYLTAHADEATIRRAAVTQPHGFLIKPVKTDDLRCAIEVSLYRHDMETRLRERERWFSTTLRSIADAVLAVDLSGRVTFMNSVAEKLTGVSSVDALGKPVREVLLIDARPGIDAESALEEALRRQCAVEMLEADLVNASTGALRTISDSAAPVSDEGRMLGAVMVFRDITDQKRMQTKLELTDRLTSLGTMAAGVAHEVNNRSPSFSPTRRSSPSRCRRSEAGRPTEARRSPRETKCVSMTSWAASRTCRRP